jgi:hypothetical protein
VRSTIAVVSLFIVLAALTSCSSSPRDAAAISTPPPTGPEVVDGITVPPVYVAPSATVVPGPTTCPTDFSAALSANAGGSRFMLATQLTSHLLSCTYLAPAGTSGCSGASILINTEPQAFTAFNRWNVETGQTSMWSANPALQPTPIAGIGIEAEWVPALNELGAGDDTTWVSVTLTCGQGTLGALELAERLAVEGLASTA